MSFRETENGYDIPVEHFPFWRHYMGRFKRWEVHPGYRRYFASTTKESIAAVRRHIKRHGPTKPRDIASEKVNWDNVDWPAPTVAKVSIEYLWRMGEMAVTRRDGQEKVYDLASRVIPEKFYRARVTQRAYVDWACESALRRLGAATAAQIARHLEAVSTEDVQVWCKRNLGESLEAVTIELADGTASRPVFTLGECLRRLDDVPECTRQTTPAQPVRPPDPRPQADGPGVRLRLRGGDLCPCRQA